jgi:hypothetical protein
VFYSGLFSTGIGSALTLAGLYFLRRAARLRWFGFPARATVVEHIEVADVAVPVVEFCDLSGARHRAKLQDAGCPPVGQPIRILYDRQEPARAIAGPLLPLGVFAGVLVSVGLAAMAVGIGTWAGVVKDN